MTGTKSTLAESFSCSTCPCFRAYAALYKENVNMLFLGRLNHMSVSIHSFFLGELEKCLEDPDRLGPLFVKQVRNALVLQHDFVKEGITCSYL